MAIPSAAIGRKLAEPDMLFRSFEARSVWLPVLVAGILLYAVAYLDLFRAVETTDGAALEPVCALIWAWVIWRHRSSFFRLDITRSGLLLGWTSLAVGLTLYAIGRSQDFFQLEIGSQLLVFPGAILILLGFRGLRNLWFPIVFLVFLIPVPGSVLNEILVPLKQTVSSVVAQGLYPLGVPITRDGVVLYVGNYQLLIADACSGLNSMIALSAIGVLYVYMSERRNWISAVILLAAVIPIAFAANLVRVAGLVLVTYLFGDAAGQNFHDVASYAEIGLVFLAFFLFDRVLRLIFRSFDEPKVGAVGE